MKSPINKVDAQALLQILDQQTFKGRNEARFVMALASKLEIFVTTYDDVLKAEIEEAKAAAEAAEKDTVEDGDDLPECSGPSSEES